MKTLAELAAQFATPPLAYSPIPFWFLNGDMDHAELGRQLRLMHAIGIGGVGLHARQGHTVKYLSQEWLDTLRFCVDTCAELGMQAWLYDEDNFPSGYAGGEVLRRYPEGYAKCLAVVPLRNPRGDGRPRPSDDPPAVVVATTDDYAFVQQLTPWHPAFSPDWYVDMLDPRVTELFIECTHELCAQALGDHLGTTVTAVFTDEPGFYNHFYDCAPGTIPWTPDLPEQFEQRMGYSLLPHLPALFGDDPTDAAASAVLPSPPRGEGAGGEVAVPPLSWKERGPGGEATPAVVRRDFYRVISQLFLERFYLPQRRWCNEHGMQFVGHVNNEELLVDHVRLNADYFTAMDGFDMPGLDIIFIKSDYRRAPDSIVPKLASSAAHIRGKSQVMTETYGAMGWDLAPDEMRRIADWQIVRGVTRFVPHAFYYSIAGERYFESPPSLFFQSPHWPYMAALMQYITRWTWLLENTRPVSHVAVYYPIDAVREVTTPDVGRSLPPGIDEDASEAGRLGKSFRAVLDTLFRAKVDFDVVDDVALAAAEITPGQMQIGDLTYRCLVLPPGEPSAEAQVVIARAREAGIEVIAGDAATVLPRAEKWAIATLAPPTTQLTVARRRALTGEVIMIVNEGEEKYEGTLVLPLTGKLAQWDLSCGQLDEWPAEVAAGQTRIALTLLAGAAMCFAVETTD